MLDYARYARLFYILLLCYIILYDAIFYFILFHIFPESYSSNIDIQFFLLNFVTLKRTI